MSQTFFSIFFFFFPHHQNCPRFDERGSPALPAALVAGVLAERTPPQEQKRQQGRQRRPEHVHVAAHFASSGVKLW